MIKIGMIIGERYEILEKIGTGGMSDVYKAKDSKLNRFIAVKVLKQEFSENANFVSKFRVEAQAAAGLMHPNIVNVYDVGEEDGVYYIVMELVEGITLKKYIEKKARLSAKEAISIAIQVSMGIEAAHNNHIIHRDIKPQNIIISKDGKVKVTDFGIAKAATSNTITSNVMGSVHYTSPEQARGGYSDERSDVYSLGVTLFEMLTGRVPFNGETTVAIAIKHIQEDMPSPKEFVAEIPTSVEQIVLKCCQKSPDRRYQSMGELVEDLKQSLLNPEADFVVMHDPDEASGTRVISDEEMNSIKRSSSRNDFENTMHLRADAYRGYEEEEYADGYDSEEYPEDGDYDYSEEDNRMEKITTILAVVAGVLICCIIIYLVAKIFGVFGGNKKVPEKETEENPVTALADVEMIDVAGKNVEDAKKALVAMGLNPDVVYVESEAIAEGEVISADVSVGAKISPGSTVKLTVSSGTNGKEVPATNGLSYSEALTKLENAGFTVNKKEVYSSDVQKDYVISQNPEAGTKAPSGSVITVKVSLGQEDTKVRVPNVIGLTQEDASVAMADAGLNVGSVTTEFSSQVESGKVSYQSCSVGSYVEAGTAIDIRISQGAQPKTYVYSGSIGAPTSEEAGEGGFKAGTEVHVVLTGIDGTVLQDTTVTSFPLSLNISNIKCSSGTLTLTYKVVTEGVTETDADGNVVVISEEKVEEKVITRTIGFAEQ